MKNKLTRNIFNGIDDMPGVNNTNRMLKYLNRNIKDNKHAKAVGGDITF